MPYLSFSIQCREADDDGKYEQENEDTNNHSPSTKREPTEQEKLELKKLTDERKKYQSLLNAYHGLVIHGSSTLDEWYYHFASDLESTKDRRIRNKSQVVTNNLPEGTGEHIHWPLIRVNQLWVWTVANSMSRRKPLYFH